MQTGRMRQAGVAGTAQAVDPLRCLALVLGHRKARRRKGGASATGVGRGRIRGSQGQVRLGQGLQRLGSRPLQQTMPPGKGRAASCCSCLPIFRDPSRYRSGCLGYWLQRSMRKPLGQRCRQRWTATAGVVKGLVVMMGHQAADRA